MLLEGDHYALAALREQLRHASVSSREFTGVGFFADLTVAPDASRIAGRPKFQLTNVAGTAANVQHGVGFVLFIEDGVLSMLEGFTYDEPWPDRLQDVKLEYWGNRKNDLDALARLK